MHGGDIYSHKIKHDFSININPLGLPLAGKIAYLRALKKISNYPDLNCGVLKELLSKRLGIPSENLVFGNGASELINGVILATGVKRVLLFAPSFTGYERAVKSCGAEVFWFYLNEKDDFSFGEEDFSRLSAVVQREMPDLLILANPNNPNGKLLQKKSIEKIIQFCAEKGIKLLLDECFIELTGLESDFSFEKELLGKGRGIFIIRAFTKTYAIPGIRLGYCICDCEESALALKNQLPEWNVSAVAQEVGVGLLKTGERYLKKARNLICRERDYLSKELKALGLIVFDSDVNFILFKEDFGGGAQPAQVGVRTGDVGGSNRSQIDAPLPTSLYKKMLALKILIRDCSDYEGLGAGYYRVAVRCHRENRRLIKALKKARGK